MDSSPGLYSLYTTDNGSVTTYARFAAFNEQTDPIKAYVFNAKSYTVEGEKVTPVKEQFSGDSDYKHVAEYIGPNTTTEIEDTVVVFYHLDEFDDLCLQDRIPSEQYLTARENGSTPPLPGFIQYYVLSELHELCHWAAPADDQPETYDHWTFWNAILCDVISYSTPGIEWNPDFNYDIEATDSPFSIPDQTKSARDSVDNNT